MSTATVHSKPRFSTHNIGLTQRDLDPVQFLVQRAQVNPGVPDTAQMMFACITWINAFTQFKHQRKQHGIPADKADAYLYGMVLGQLKITGKALAALIAKGAIDPSFLPISAQNFEACVRELQCDDVLLDMGLLSPEKNLDHIASIFTETAPSEHSEHPAPA